MLTQTEIEKRVNTIRELTPEYEKKDIYCDYMFRRYKIQCIKTIREAVEGMTFKLGKDDMEYIPIGNENSKEDDNRIYFLRKDFVPTTPRQKEECERFYDKEFDEWNLNGIEYGNLLLGTAIEVIYLDLYQAESILRFLKTGHIGHHNKEEIFIPVERLDPALCEITREYLSDYFRACAAFHEPNSVIEKYLNELQAHLEEGIHEKYGNGKKLLLKVDDVKETCSIAQVKISKDTSKQSIEVWFDFLTECDSPTDAEKKNIAVIEKYRSGTHNDREEDELDSAIWNLRELKHNLISREYYEYDIHDMYVVKQLLSLNFTEFKLA